MKYTVTFCVFDHTVGANPFGHGSFFLSKLDENRQLLEVVETWGFYGVTSTGDKSGWFEQLKIKSHLDIDFQGNHGMLINEEVRFMDLGHGLHGYTFELTQDQFEVLQERCAQAVVEQEDAIREVIDDGRYFPPDPSKKGRIYKEEAYSKQIFEMEQIKAKNEERPSRLKPFDLQLSLGFSGPSLKNSNTCKTTAVSLLEGILTENQLTPFKNSSLPRFIRGLEPILLHSEGPLRTHIKESGKEVLYRDRKQDNDVKLYWSVPPQRFDQLSEDTEDLFSIDKEYCQEVKHIVSQLQSSEWLIRNAPLPEQYQDYKEDLIERIVGCYKEFAIIESKKDVKISGWKGFALSLFSAPRSEEEGKLQEKIHKAKMLLTSLYIAMVDGWAINDNSPSETSASEDAEDYNPLEALASYLSLEDKKNLCKIIGRNYLESEEELSPLEFAPI